VASLLLESGFSLTEDPSAADIIVLNTCGFIAPAKEEAIRAILEAADRKPPGGACRFVVVAGCLAQRYPDEILEEFPEVDAVVGTRGYADIPWVIGCLSDAARKGGGVLPAADRIRHVPAGDSLAHLGAARRPSTPVYAYLKVSEGCSNRCAYCAIPGIRGDHVSRPMDDLIAEAVRLAGIGTRELVLVAQDTTRYGLDLSGRRLLPDLVRRLAAIPGILRIRLMYAYADGVDDALIDLFRTEPKLARYLDLPIQHASDPILGRMNRRDTRHSLEALLHRLRRDVPGIVLRTTVLVGFPGETEQDMDVLLSFLRAIRFDRLGCFVFSPEEGTPAAAMEPKVPESVAESRYHRVMALQQAISAASLRRRVGTVESVLIESVSDDGIFYLGRTSGEAPEIDPLLHVAATSEPLAAGQLVRVRWVDASDYDLTGVTVDDEPAESPDPPADPPRAADPGLPAADSVPAGME